MIFTRPIVPECFAQQFTHRSVLAPGEALGFSRHRSGKCYRDVFRRSHRRMPQNGIQYDSPSVYGVERALANPLARVGPEIVRTYVVWTG